MARVVTLQDLLARTLKTESGCLEWIGAKDPSGYGRVRIAGKSINAHRASIILSGNDIPQGMDVCHKCDNRICINPEHLFVGTRKDNVQDMINKGRSAKALKGEDNPLWKPIEHGTKNAYDKFCRCDVCRAGAAKRMRIYRSKIFATRKESQCPSRLSAQARKSP